MWPAASTERGRAAEQIAAQFLQQQGLLIIGRNVRIYQGVTLGAKSFPLDGQGKPVKGVERHPIVEDDVVIYAGATILGRVTIGRGAVIGGNVWLTRDVPPGTLLTVEAGRGEARTRGMAPGKD